MSRSLISTHILDTALGRPASGVAVMLSGFAPSGWSPIAAGITDDNGRIDELGPESLVAGKYRLTFETESYFAAQSLSSFFPEVVLAFTVAEGEQHYHVPLLLSPFAYSTYRGN